MQQTNAVHELQTNTYETQKREKKRELSPLLSILGYLPQFFAKIKCNRRIEAIAHSHKCKMKETNRAAK